MAQVEKAKVFMSGRSRAARIPAEYRFTTDEVYIRDSQSGDLILSEAPGERSFPRHRFDNSTKIRWP